MESCWCAARPSWLPLPESAPLIIGITIVSFGTGAPELAVTVHAAHAGSTELAIGNVVGSNIANVFLILGASALVTPLAVESRIVKADVPMILAVLGIGAMVAPDDIPVSADAVRLDIPIMIAAALARLPLFFTGCRPSRTGGGQSC